MCGLGLVGRNHEGRPRYICAKVPGSAHCGRGSPCTPTAPTTR